MGLSIRTLLIMLKKLPSHNMSWPSSARKHIRTATHQTSSWHPIGIDSEPRRNSSHKRSTQDRNADHWSGHHSIKFRAYGHEFSK
mmetsp:Transcript_22263/g.52473  ORF Transcript_22263/g.52473 Transcript_22263/m.52473 type:complete len:85 (+) Transcript_22263:863-1117(+)